MDTGKREEKKCECGKPAVVKQLGTEKPLCMDCLEKYYGMYGAFSVYRIEAVKEAPLISA